MELQRPFVLVPDDPGPDALREMLDAKVVRVFDGDGFLADVWHPHETKWINRVPFRFAFIDAPEMDQPFGGKAKAFLQRSIAGKNLRLDPIGKESTGYAPIDQYKRMLCMAYLTEEMEVGETAYFLNGKCEVGIVKRARPVTRNIELEMVINGWAWVTEQYAFDREEEYFAAQDDARREKRGLWEMDDPEPPWKFKQKQKRLRSKASRQPNLF